MDAATAQSMATLIIGILAIIILLKILMIVHGQNRHVKDLELRMKAMEQADQKPEGTTVAEKGE